MTFTAREIAYLKILLNEAAQPGEIATATSMLATSLRERKVSPEAFEALLEKPLEPMGSEIHHHHDRHRTDAEIALAYVTGIPCGKLPEHRLPDEFANLIAQFSRQCVTQGRLPGRRFHMIKQFSALAARVAALESTVTSLQKQFVISQATNGVQAHRVATASDLGRVQSGAYPGSICLDQSESGK